MIIDLATCTRPRLQWSRGPGGWTAETAPPSIVDWRGLSVDPSDPASGFRWLVEAADMSDPDPAALCVLASGMRPTLTAAKVAAEAAARAHV